MTSPNIRIIAFYLPQFHPIPENDAWWGRGFTEWTNVVKARPLFPGHEQPHLPADLGFYDLRLPEVRQAQADLAEEYGIYGFCYYHYWFQGQRLLDRPFREVLTSGSPDFPFCLCWANEHWTRRWDGLEQEILMKQGYSDDDDRRHIRWLAEGFEDNRYIRIDGKPVFLVYRANKLLDSVRTTTIWREEAQKLGIGDLFLCRQESLGDERGDPVLLGFDAAVEFQPDWRNLGQPLQRSTWWQWARQFRLAPSAFGSNLVFDYAEIVERMLKKRLPPYLRFPCVMPRWDNTPRRQANAYIFRNSTPAAYERWLCGTIEKLVRQPPLVFINAWNEWGEGAHLEPCQQWGRAYLEATRNALRHSHLGQAELGE
jgi:lipopolysaccharide biosynthesis protein